MKLVREEITMKTAVLSCIAATAIAAPHADAARLIANNITTSNLVEIDPVTGNATSFTTHQIPGNVSGLAFQQQTGTLYGISNSGNPAFQGIYTFDLETGAAQLAPITQFVPHPIATVSALAADPNSNKLYALQTGSTTRSAIWEIDLDAGTYNQLTVDFDPFMSALTFTDDGRLLAGSTNFFTGQGSLYEINLDTIEATELFSSADLRMTGLTVDADTGQILATYNGGTGAQSSIFSIGDEDGSTQLIASNLSGNYLALVSVPAPGGAALLGLAGMAAIRRRR